MGDQLDPKNHGGMWLAIMGITVLFVAAILIFTKNNPLPEPHAAQTVRPPRQYSVSYNHGIFSPTNLQIRTKDSVAFRNESEVTMSIDGSFGPSGDLVSSAVYTHVFTEAGTYDYYNVNNKNERGTITVRP
ncbi:MAG: hypothetical protein AAB483_02635 [Patescibacteria group bacterium]